MVFPALPPKLMLATLGCCHALAWPKALLGGRSIHTETNASTAWHPSDILKTPSILLSFAERYAVSEAQSPASVDAVNASVPVTGPAVAPTSAQDHNASSDKTSDDSEPAADADQPPPETQHLQDDAASDKPPEDSAPAAEADQPQPRRAPEPPPTRVGVSTGTHVKRRGKYDTWQHLKQAQRDVWDPSLTAWLTPEELFHSTSFRQWSVFWTVIPCCVLLSKRLLDWSLSNGRHFDVALIWLLIAVAFNGVIYASSGVDKAAQWMTGYLLEVMFSLENVFALHSIIQAFDLSKKATKNALLAVVCAQIMFQLVMYMGLAHCLRSMGWLPYLLGTWLICLGVESSREDDEGNSAFDVKSSTLYKALCWILGDRIISDDSDRLACSTSSGYRITLGGMLAMFLIMVDFLLCIDVVLTKIQELDNAFMAFSSSAIASFLVPEFVFMVEEMFEKYSLLKYAISFVLMFFGVQMLAAAFSLYCVPDLLGCAIIVLVLMAAMAASPKPQVSIKQLRET